MHESISSNGIYSMIYAVISIYGDNLNELELSPVGKAWQELDLVGFPLISTDTPDS